MAKRLPTEEDVHCPVCEEWYKPISSGLVRVHNVRGAWPLRRCEGSKKIPKLRYDGKPLRAGEPG